MIAAGDAAPDFTIVADDGTSFTLSDHLGHPVVLFFYPQDDTEGCTIENQEFSLLAEDFRATGAILAGISPDSIADHCTFRDKYDLAVPLLSDPDHLAIAPYGLWQQKTLYGRNYLGLVRTTVVVGPTGTVFEVIRATRIKGHAQKVLDCVKRMTAAVAP